MGQRVLGRGELDDAKHEGRHRREGVQRNRRSGVKQRREAHMTRPLVGTDHVNKINIKLIPFTLQPVKRLEGST